MIEEFSGYLAHQDRELKRLARDKGLVGWTCAYVPLEIIRAAGLGPVRVLGVQGSTPLADALFNTNICRLARGCLEAGLCGKYDFLTGLVGSEACAATRRTLDAWSHQLAPPFLHQISAPNTSGHLAVEFFQERLRSFREALETFTGREITEAALDLSIREANQVRALLWELFMLRNRNPGLLSGTETAQVVLAGQVMEQGRFKAMLQKLLDRLRNQPPGSKPPGPRIILIGSGLDDPHLIGLIESRGCIVAADSLCTGTALFCRQVEEGPPALVALAEYYLKRLSCPYMAPPKTRLDYLEELVQTFRADGVIFHEAQGCHCHGGQFPLVRDFIKNLGLPLLRLEGGSGPSRDGQIKVRVEAFVEIMEG